MPERRATGARHPSHRIWLRRGLRVGGRHDLDLVARLEERRASAGAWLAGPPTSGGQMPETTTTLTSSPPRRRP